MRNRFGSAAADQAYSQNWARIKDPVLDFLIDKAIAARTARELYAATRAIDRVLLWKFYFIPGMAQPGYRLVHLGQVRRSEGRRAALQGACHRRMVVG